MIKFLKPLLQYLGIGFFCLVCAFGLYEGTLRMFFEPPQLVDVRSRQNPVTDAGVFGQKLKIRLNLETETGRRLRPNTIVNVTNNVVSHRDIILTTNSLGYRNREIGKKIRPRILFLGDSITEADYVPDEETFVRQVEKLSEQHENPVETINAGVGAEGLSTYFHILKETGLKTDPDLVVVDLYLNDFQSSRTVRLFYPPAWLQWSWAANHLYYAFSIRYSKFTQRGVHWDDNIPRIPDSEIQLWREKLECCFQEFEPTSVPSSRFQNAVKSTLQDYGGAWSEGAWRRMSETLREMNELLRQRHIPMLLIIFPFSLQVEENELYNFPQRKANEIAQRLNIPFLDPLPILRDEWRVSSEKLFYDQCHFTPRGNQIVAQIIFDFLRVSKLVQPANNSTATGELQYR